MDDQRNGYRAGDRVRLVKPYKFNDRLHQHLVSEDAVGTVSSTYLTEATYPHSIVVVWDDIDDEARDGGNWVDMACIQPLEAPSITEQELAEVYRSLGVSDPTPCPTCGCTCSQSEQSS